MQESCNPFASVPLILIFWWQECKEIGEILGENELSEESVYMK